MKRVFAVTLSVMVCAGLLLTACQPASSQEDEVESSETASQQETLGPAKFSVSELSISPTEAKPGQQVSVTATLLNSGGSKGKYEVEFSVNGANWKFKFFHLDPGESTTVTFTVSKEATGEYEVNISGLSGSFIVE